MSIMKKIYIKVLVACSVLFAFNSCALENEIYEDINPDVFPQNEEDIKAMLVANAYNVFSSDQYNGIFAVATGYQTCSDMVTDQAENSWVGWDYRYNSYEAGDWYLDGDAGTTNRSPYQYANRLSAMSLTIDRIKM